MNSDQTQIKQISVNDLSLLLAEKLKHSSTKSLEFLKPWIAGLELSDWHSIEKYEDERYARIIIHQSPEFDILLVCWKPGQYSPPHEHPVCGCLMKVIEGRLREDVLVNGEVVSSRKYLPGEVRFICNEIGQHAVYNISDGNTISLHIYAPGEYVPD